MARSIVPITVVDSAGNAVANASVLVKSRATGANATLYTTEGGPTTANNPTSTDAGGRVNAWVNPGAYNAVVSGTGFTTYTQPFDIATFVNEPVTTLPANPVNGQTCTYAVAGQGVYWNLVYNGSAWSFLGGGPIMSRGSGSTNYTANSSSVLVAGTGPSITLPLAGSYIFSGGGSVLTNAGATGVLVLSVNGTVAQQSDNSTSFGAVNTSVSFLGSVAGELPAYSLSANSTVRLGLVTSGQGTVFTNYTYLKATPLVLN